MRGRLGQPEFDKFCGHCGVSLHPLDTNHISAECDVCGKKKYFIRLGENGVGIKVNKGESMTVFVPPLSLKLGDGKLFKPGVGWLLRMMLFPPDMRSRDVPLKRVLEQFDDQFEAVISESAFFKERNLTLDGASDADWRDFFEAVKDDEGNRELWAFQGSLHTARLRDELKSGDVENSLISMHFAVRYAAILATFGDVEETLWRGYCWNQSLYEAAGIGDDPLKVAAVEKLAEKYDAYSQVALAHIASGNPGHEGSETNSPLTADEVRNVAQFVLEGKQKEHDRQLAERKLALDKLNLWVIAGITIGAAGLSSVLDLLGRWWFGSN